MQLYSEKLKLKFRMLYNEPGINGDRKRKTFAEKKLLPFLYELLDETVSNDGLEKLSRRNVVDKGAGASISVDSDGHAYYNHNNEAFLLRWVDYYKKEGISKYQKDEMMLNEMQRFNHEERHHMQHHLAQEYDLSKLSPNALIYIKENLLINANYDWYRQNHGKFWIEREADIYGYNRTIDFVSKTLPNTDFSKNCQEKLSYNAKHFANPEEYFNGDDAFCYLISKNFDDVMAYNSKSNSNIMPYLFDKYPALSLIYRNDGTKKNIEEVMQIRRSYIQNNLSHLQNIVEIDGEKMTYGSHINKLFSVIINTDKDLQKQYIEYKNKHKTNKTDYQSAQENENNIEL